MTLKVGTSYILQNVYTGNLISMNNGLIAFAGPSPVTGPALEAWEPILQEAENYQFRNPQTDCVIAGWPDGRIFGYAGAASPDQSWTTTAAPGHADTFILRNLDNHLYLGDLNGCGVSGPLTGGRWVDPYHAARYYWHFQAI